MIFIDTNYFVRFLLKDLTVQYKAARNLFEAGAKGDKILFTSTIVIFEIYWLFSSFYQKTKPEVVDILRKTLSLSFIEITERKIIEKAVEIFESSNLDLEDSYNIAYSVEKKAEHFLTFDRQLDNFLKKNKFERT